MTWLHFLTYISAGLQITANASVISYVYPAYKKTKSTAFLLIGFACLLGTFDTIFSHTIVMTARGRSEYILYYTLREFAYYAVVILDTAGVILLVKSYLEIIQHKVSDEVSNT